MLGIKKSHLKSATGKIVLLLLIISFALGMGGVITPSSDPVVITVGDKEMRLSQWQQTLNNVAKAYNANPNDNSFKYEFLSNYIKGELIKLEAKNLGFLVSTDMVKLNIASDPTFHNDENKFDKDKFDYILKSNNISEKKFTEIIKDDISKGMYQSPFTFNLGLGQDIGKLIEQSRRLTKKGVLYKINMSDVKLEQVATDDDLQEIYEKYSQLFIIPEKREVSYLTISLNDVKTSIPTDSELKNYFELNSMQFAEQEKRTVEQMRFDTEEEALKAYNNFEKSKARKLKAFAKENSLESFTSSNLSKEFLPEDLGEFIFSLEQNEVSEPIISPIGWVIMQLTEITPYSAPNFEKNKKEVKAKYLEEKQSEALVELAGDVENDILSDIDILDISKNYKLSLNEATVVQNQASEENSIISTPEFTETAFSLAEGEQSVIIEQGENNYFMVKVNSITPEDKKQFIDVRADLQKIWAEQERYKKSYNIAGDLIEKLILKSNDNSNPSIKEFVKENNINAQTVEFSFYDNSTKLPNTVKEAVIFMEPNTTIPKPIIENKNAYVFSMNSFGKNKEDVDSNVKSEIGNQTLQINYASINAQLLQYLQNKYPIDVNEQLIMQPIG